MDIFNPQFVNLIRETSFDMEKEGVISQEALQFICDNKLFKLFLPQEVGGTMTALPEALRIFERASWINGSFGWAVTIGSGGGYFYSCVPSSVASDVFAGRKAVIAGSGHPSGTARKVEGGYVLNGSWKYNSGSPYATVFTATCVVEDPSGPEDQPVRAFFLQPEQVRIIEDWDAFGLKATASHSTAVTEAFVPEHMAFDVFNNTFSDYPIYRYPFLTFAEASFTAVAAGIGKHFLEEASAVLERNEEAWNRANPARSAFVSSRIRDMEQRLVEQAFRFYEAIELSWVRHCNGEKLSEEEWRLVGSQCKKTAKTAYECAQNIFPYMGLGATMENTLINQAWRDLQTVCHHSILVEYQD